MLSKDLSSSSGDGHAVVALRGELDLVDAASVAFALAMIAGRDPVIVADLAGLEFIDSSGVVALAGGRRRGGRTRGGRRGGAPPPAAEHGRARPAPPPPPPPPTPRRPGVPHTR